MISHATKKKKKNQTKFVNRAHTSKAHESQLDESPLNAQCHVDAHISKATNSHSSTRSAKFKKQKACLARFWSIMLTGSKDSSTSFAEVLTGWSHFFSSYLMMKTNLADRCEDTLGHKKFLSFFFFFSPLLARLSSSTSSSSTEDILVSLYWVPLFQILHSWDWTGAGLLTALD